ncbi:hypothetical protein TCAL_15542 [Tigriopus californicus]|uniref:Uncharacterized protein n=1 Tax=Tigriopus californicus TaxID=6832 RepID=A0A553PTC1_TIGCA|nr:hypothetical protein TCAL_15542 [Tigriopus californicus]
MAVAGEGTGLEGESSSVSYTEEEVSYITEEDSEDEGKRVEWPPHGHKGQGQAAGNNTHIKTFAAESIFHNDKHNKESLGTGRGTSRTKKAQEMYNKHLDGVNIPPETMMTTQ